MPHGPAAAPRRTPRAVVNDFVDNWGEDMLGPLAEHLLSNPPLGGQDDGAEGRGRGHGGAGREGLSDLWPRLSRIHESMEDLEASRTKVELARQLTVDRSNPESISHVLDKVDTNYEHMYIQQRTYNSLRPSGPVFIHSLGRFGFAVFKLLAEKARGGGRRLRRLID